MQKLITPKDGGRVKKLGKIAEYRNGKSYENHFMEKGKYFLITLNSIDINGKFSK
ncbi:MAG: hypothetical protein KAV44_07005 [Bacteroidales bacterium]|nr:hypothetical protein [Bacteroidales bacterium]